MSQTVQVYKNKGAPNGTDTYVSEVLANSTDPRMAESMGWLMGTEGKTRFNEKRSVT